MKKSVIALALVMMAGGAFADDFSRQLSADAAGLKAAAAENKAAVTPGPARGVLFQEPYPGWWVSNPDVLRIKAEFDQLSIAVDQVNGANNFTTWGARASACRALQNISREGASPNPDTVNNLNCVINWMLNDVDGKAAQINKINSFVYTWSMVGSDPMLQIFTGWLPDHIANTKCVGNHSRYLRDRIHGVSASSGIPYHR